MPPPPPPPPGAPPPPSLPAFAPSSGGGKKGDRKDLLKDIQQGRRLKPTQTNDRSGPSLGGKPSSAPSGGGTSGGGSPVKNQDVGGSSQVGPLPGIGGLFANGIPTLKKTRGGIQTGRSFQESDTSTAQPARPGPGYTNPNKNSYNSTASSLESPSSKKKTSSGGFLHSYFFGENPVLPENRFPGQGYDKLSGENLNFPSVIEKNTMSSYPIQKTKSSDAIQYKHSNSKPGKLSKTKSSTYISPEQSERIMYNSKVTLTLRKSRQNLNIDDDTYSQGKLQCSDIHANGFNETEKPSPSVGVNGRVRKMAEDMRSQCPTPPPLSAKPTLRQTLTER